MTVALQPDIHVLERPLDEPTRDAWKRKAVARVFCLLGKKETR